MMKMYRTARTYRAHWSIENENGIVLRALQRRNGLAVGKLLHDTVEVLKY